MSLPIDAFISSLTDFRGENLHNPWAEVSETDISDDMPALRRRLLKQHLLCPTPCVILVNDTNNYYGSRQTGVSMTSEYLVINRRIPRLNRVDRITNTTNPMHDTVAAYFWQVLHRHGIADYTICWDLLPFQPYRPSTGLNRKPTKDELACGRIWLHELLVAYPNVPVIGVGARVRNELQHMGRREAFFVANPARSDESAADQVIMDIAARSEPLANGAKKAALNYDDRPSDEVELRT
jgi:hypothetical protein